MTNNRYIITKSNYTLKEKHKGLKSGSEIFERDYMITTNLGGYDSGAIPYGESNFKFVYNQNKNTTKSFNNGNWIPNFCNGTNIWTLDCTSQTQQKEESEIVIKPNHNTLLDFAYFGSCVELVKTSLDNINKYYPGELYVTDKNFIYEDADGNVRNLGDDAFANPVVVSNPFNIDLITKNAQITPEQYLTDNVLRCLSDSISKYELMFNDTTHCLNSITVKTKNKKCYENGELISNIVIIFDDGNTMEINEYYYEQTKILITSDRYYGWHIRPTESEIEDVFNNKFSMFDNFLLNRDSNPIYTIEIDTPRETDTGIINTRTFFTMPTVYGWNIDIDSADYSTYVTQLLNVATFYDEHYTNNLWENIVHESIKNMDVNWSNPLKDEDVNDYRLGIQNIHGLMLAYGRQFDDIKLTIDNIKSTNTVTYNENNNIPDYFLSDSLELSGWEVTSAAKYIDKDTSVEKLFPGTNKSYTADDVNTTFMRNLKINSKSIFTRKGTRQSIEMLLSLFGLSSYEFGRNYYNCLPETYKIKRSGQIIPWENLTDEEQANFYDYKFDEYVVVAKNTADDIIDADDYLCVEQINQQIKGDSVYTIVDGLYNDSVEIVNSLEGLPVRMVYIAIPENNEIVYKKYIIPWFSKNVTYDGKTYFQMYGGWDRIINDNPYYMETLKYLNILETIGDLKTKLQSDVSEGEIYYVNNISDYKDYYPSYPDSIQPSHYFYLNDVTKTYQYQDYGETTGGWEIIPQSDVDGIMAHGIQVHQLESIIDDYRGNNPHVGYGKYDEGDKYLERLAHIFDGAFDDGLFDNCIYTCDDNEMSIEDIKNLGFTLTDRLIDNVKCWYFVDNTIENQPVELRKTYVKVDDDGYIVQEDEEVEHYNEIQLGYDDVGYTHQIRVGRTAYQVNDVHFTSQLETFNFETQETDSNDEAAANSVINVKNVTLEFNKFKYNNDDFENYLHEVILFYLNQIIPSTTMMTLKYFRDETYAVCTIEPEISGIS